MYLDSAKFFKKNVPKKLFMQWTLSLSTRVLTGFAVYDIVAALCKKQRNQVNLKTAISAADAFMRSA